MYFIHLGQVCLLAKDLYNIQHTKTKHIFTTKIVQRAHSTANPTQSCTLKNY